MIIKLIINYVKVYKIKINYYKNYKLVFLNLKDFLI